MVTLIGHWTKAEMFRHVLRPRVLVYTAILVLIVGALGVSLWLRAPFKVDVVRDRASLARIVDDGWIENVYTLQMMNTTERPQRYSAVATGLDGIVLDGGREIMLAPAENKWVPVAVRVPPEVAAQAGAGAHKIVIQVKLLDGDTTLDEKTTFMVPR